MQTDVKDKSEFSCVCAFSLCSHLAFILPRQQLSHPSVQPLSRQLRSRRSRPRPLRCRTRVSGCLKHLCWRRETLVTQAQNFIVDPHSSDKRVHEVTSLHFSCSFFCHSLMCLVERNTFAALCCCSVSVCLFVPASLSIAGLALAFSFVDLGRMRSRALRT